MFTKLHIEYANPSDLTDSIVVPYRLRQTAIAQRWVNKVLTAQQQYQVDDLRRFYGFGSYAEQVQDALDRINHNIMIINLHDQLINRTLTDVNDQDTLNYLHSIFEVYHGLLDYQQDDDHWQTLPESVKLALADLNLCVHRCESVARGAQPRHVVTWYGLPKTDVLDLQDYDQVQYTWGAGTVFLNYAEIGKTLEDLAFDNDQYIAPGAFQPFRHFSADFVVRFYEQTPEQAREKRAIIDAYYRSKKHFFGEWHPHYRPGNIAVADIIDRIPFEELETKQYVKSVSFM
jgi:hypothetical protein